MTAERISSHETSENPIFQRHLVAYNRAKEIISGNVLEIGCGEGYGIEYLAPACTHITAVDKFHDTIDRMKSEARYKNTTFMQMEVPFLDFEDNSFDYVVSFQVIEHIEDDHSFVKEVARVLKPGGKFVVSTPNIKMSLTRNPWHVREYTVTEFSQLLEPHFNTVEPLGVYGNDAVTDYYLQNKAGVEKFKKLDIFNLEHRLPRRILQIPYDILNRMNRKMIQKGEQALTSGIRYTDYHISEATDTCYDLFYIGTKVNG